MQHTSVIEPEDLCLRLDDPGTVVLDCRYDLADGNAGRVAYQEGHIPGAHYACLHSDLSAPLGRFGGRHPLPSADQFSAFARAVGISPASTVIVYDENRLAFAARAWWLLRYFGHTNVAVLNGGLNAWRELGLPLESGEAPRVESGSFEARADESLVLTYEDVLAGLPSPPWQLIDARDPARFSGTEEPIDPIAGHIPTAINRPWLEVTDANGRLLDASALSQRWQGVPSDQPLVNYCGSGVTACVNLLSLHLLGKEDARLYAGSWSDWCAHILHQEATGAE